MPYTDKGGRIYKYGEFFPNDASPFAYNESVAQEHFPLKQVDAEKMGFTWKEMKEKNYKATISPFAISDDPKKIDDTITTEVIGCINEGKGEHNCTIAFRILPDELQFYKQLNVPIPVFCPNCRHHQRLKQRNALKLFKRKCQCAGQESENKLYKNTGVHAHADNHCENEFETSYDPERAEIVYCEKCYQQEVY